jgi:hypothetical protein
MLMWKGANRRAFQRLFGGSPGLEYTTGIADLDRAHNDADPRQRTIIG